jgi:hypothetical protein
MKSIIDLKSTAYGISYRSWQLYRVANSTTNSTTTTPITPTTPKEPTHRHSSKSTKKSPSPLLFYNHIPLILLRTILHRQIIPLSPTASILDKLKLAKFENTNIDWCNGFIQICLPTVFGYS